MIMRRALTLAAERMVDEPVVLLEGPRTVGKSTLLRALAAAHGGVVIDLDDPATLDAAAADPATFMAGVAPVFVDEYQRAPVLLDAIKAELNRDGSPGRFVLTGSTSYEALPQRAQALTGRLHRVTVYPLSQGEIGGVHEHLIADLFTDAEAAVAGPLSVTTRADYIDKIVTGGFPMALSRATEVTRNRWFDDYIRLTLERDVAELRHIRSGTILPRLFEHLAGQTAQLLNMAKIATEVGLDVRTTDSYVRLLEAVFLVQRLPAWGTTLRARATARPKLHVIDSGVAARMLRLTPNKLARLDPSSMSELGHLLETFVVGEVMRQASWLDGVATVGHWRTRDDDEVDVVVERDDGAIVAIEVKTAARVPGSEFKGLRKLRDAYGGGFLAGVAMYLGERSYTFEDRLHVMPIARLWS